MIKITTTTPRAAPARALLEQSHALMLSMFDPKDCHFLDLDALAVPEITLCLATLDGAPLGTGALKDCGTYGELKSMFTAPQARGKGIAAALVSHLENRARAQGHSHLRLETGDTLTAARRLYAHLGFTECGPFGDYVLSERSVFMEKSLTSLVS